MSEREQPMTKHRRDMHVDALRRRADALRASLRAEVATRGDSVCPIRTERRALLWAISELEEASRAGGEAE